MKKIKVFFLLQFVVITTICTLNAQPPGSFHYQAVVRDASGNVLQNQNVALRIAILQDSPTGTEVYAERHTKTTNTFGLVNLEIGTGTVIIGTFSSIPWGSMTPYLKIGIDLAGGINYADFGSSKIASVPYAHMAGHISYLQLDPVNQSVSLQAIASAANEDPIFEIRNKDGIVMLGVYNEGVRINVLDEEIKGSKSGFAVGSFSRETKGEPIEIMSLTSDSVRFYIPDHPAEKSSKGGFAVGSFSREAKGAYFDLLDISPEQARIYIDDTGAKSSKGGFAVGSFSRETKADDVNFMNITPLNYFIGHSAGVANTSGQYNSFLGFEAGMNNSMGSNNSFIGYKTGQSNINGNNNVFMGYNSGMSNTYGHNNVFLGNETGKNNLGGASNVIIGDQAGLNGNSSWNVFVGYRSGFSLTTGSHNVFLGHESGLSNTEGWSNNFIGQGAGYSNTTGTNNTFLGNDAGRNNQTAHSNIFIGRNAGYQHGEGWGNIYIGNQTARVAATGINNLVIGYSAGEEKTSGDYNVILGSYAGEKNGSGAYNVIVGSNAGRGDASFGGNTYIGYGAGMLAKGNSNVFIGHYAGMEEEESSRLIIHNNASATPLIWGNFGSRRLVIYGNEQAYTGTANFWVQGVAGGTGGWNEPSDLQLKTNIQSIPNALDRVQSLRGVEFEWKDKENFPEGKQLGFIAQEAIDFIPELVSQSGETYTMQYAQITALLVEAMKEQQNLINQQQEIIENQQKQFEELKAQMEWMKSLLQAKN
jgi:trimeric autotransporter adhesin